MNPPLDLVWIDAEDFRFPAWVALRQAILRDPIGLIYSEADLESERKERHLLALRSGAPGGGIEDKLAGGLAVRELAPGCWKVRQVAVRESQQGQGIGTLLMQHAMAAAAAEEVSQIVLHARADVVAFYGKLGYTVAGEPFEEVGIPHRRMEITLPFGSPV